MKIPMNEFLTHQWPFADMIPAYEAVRRGDVIKGLVHFYPEEEAQ